MPRSSNSDTCDWCGNGTNRIQTNGSVWLCPSCCPDMDAEVAPENAPPSWHHMTEEERADWRNGMSMDEIKEKHRWDIPPEPPAEIIGTAT